MRAKYVFVTAFFLLFLSCTVPAQKSSLAYTVKMDNPEWHFFHVQLSCKGIKKQFIDFKMPVWTPGYYQRMDYGKNLERLKATDDAGKELKWEKTADNTWRVFSNNSNTVTLTYEIKTIRSFVATPYLDETRAYILPAGVFLHIDKMINHSVEITVVPDKKWNRVATGLDSVRGKKFTYTAPDFDILYDISISKIPISIQYFFRLFQKHVETIEFSKIFRRGFYRLLLNPFLKGRHGKEKMIIICHVFRSLFGPIISLQTKIFSQYKIQNFKISTCKNPQKQIPQVPVELKIFPLPINF